MDSNLPTATQATVLGRLVAGQYLSRPKGWRTYRVGQLDALHLSTTQVDVLAKRGWIVAQSGRSPDEGDTFVATARGATVWHAWRRAQRAAAAA
ncbi:MAG: hypothetical protein HQL39_15455 [Alphaproteobacteria bacterium]|nr:hypothetical protein [Alphaproteobacteria bacterium]